MCMNKTGNRRVLAVVRHPLGGVRTHILYTYPHLIEAGYRFTFVVPKSPYHAQFCTDVKDWPDTDVIEATFRTPEQPRFWTTVRKTLRERSFSLIHSHGIQAAIPTMLANSTYGIPHLMTSQDVFCRVDLDGIVGRCKLKILQQLLRRLDVLIAVSEDTRRDHLQYLPGLRHGPCRVEMIHNGIDLQRYPHVRRDKEGGLRQQLGLNDETRLIGFLGRFMPQKGFLQLVDALRLLERRPGRSPWHLVAVGSGDFIREYQAQVAQEKLNDRITFLEHVANVAPFLQQLDLLVMPSLWEACPILPMEAMVTGIPVLGTDCIGLREVLRDTPSVMVQTNDAPAMSDAIFQALQSSWKDEAVEYIPTAQRRFDVRPVGEKLARLFDSCIRPDSTRRSRSSLGVGSNVRETYKELSEC